MEFWDVVESRHSTRDFRSDPVPREALVRVLHAASTAPSAMNSQPWRYHVAQGDVRAEIGRIVAQATAHLTDYMDVLGPERYAEAIEWYSALGNAPVIIGVSIPSGEADFDRMNTLLSVGGSIENLLLAATAEGLATCNITFAWWVRDEMGKQFGVGEGRETVAIVALGFPGAVKPVSPPHREDIADWLG